MDQVPFAQSNHAQPTSLALHRLRFVDWSPSTITSLAVSPVSSDVTNNPISSRGILAIGRQNGNIELCVWLQNKPASKAELVERSYQSNAKGWIIHTVLPGQVNSKVEQLCFANPPAENDAGVHKLRLFSISGGAIVTEHFLPPDLARAGAKSTTNSSLSSAKAGNLSSLFPGRRSNQDALDRFPGQTRTLPSLGGSIWSISPSPTGRFLAIGCEDGHVRIIDIENNKFEHLASTSGLQRGIVPRLSKAQGRVISLAWGPPQNKIFSQKTSKSLSANHQDSGSESDANDSDSDSDKETQSAWHDSFVVGGLGLSSAMVWDVVSGRITSKITVQKTRAESTIVWCVATLADGTIVTGDSTGRVTLFDAKTRVPIPGAAFRTHANGSDVLSLCVGPDGKAIYSAGVDQKVAEYALVGSSLSGKGKWAQIATRRLHSHDIRALAIDPPYDPFSVAEDKLSGKKPALNKLPILVSGGVDFNIILTPASPPSGLTFSLSARAMASIPSTRKAKQAQPLLTASEQQQSLINPISSNPLTTFADTTQRRVPFVPGSGTNGLVGGGSVATVCREKGWVVLRRETSIGIWDLGGSKNLLQRSNMDDSEPVTSQAPQWSKILEMEPKLASNLTCVAISPNGSYLALSDLYETKVFSLKQRFRQGLTELEPRKVKSFSRIFGGDQYVAPSASALCFSPDSTRLVLCSWTGSYVHVIELPTDTNSSSSNQCRLLRSFGQHRRKAGSTNLSGNSFVASADGRQITGRGSTQRPNGINGHNEANGDADTVATEDGVVAEKTTDRVERNTSCLIHHAQISSDGAWLSTISSDLQHHVFSLDSLTYGRTLPSPHTLPSGAVFHPSTNASRSSLLTLVFPDNKIEFWNVENGRELGSAATSIAQAVKSDDSPQKRKVRSGDKTAASTAANLLDENLAVLKRIVQERLTMVRESAINASWIENRVSNGTNTENNVLLVWGSTWICTARPNSLHESESESRFSQGNGEQNNHGNGNGNNSIVDVEMDDVNASHPITLESAASRWSIKFTHKYQPLVLVDAIPLQGSNIENHLVVVERPFFELASTLPPAFYRGARYGT